MKLFVSKLHFQIISRTERIFVVIWVILTFLVNDQCQSQERKEVGYFGYHPGFYMDISHLERCKIYYDSSRHILFYPCYDFSDSSIHRFELSYALSRGSYRSSDSLLILPPLAKSGMDWEDIQRHQKEAWDYYYNLWKKQDRLEKYYIDLEGLIQGIMSKPF